MGTNKKQDWNEGRWLVETQAPLMCDWLFCVTAGYHWLLYWPHAQKDKQLHSEKIQKLELTENVPVSNSSIGALRGCRDQRINLFKGDEPAVPIWLFWQLSERNYFSVSFWHPIMGDSWVWSLSCPDYKVGAKPPAVYNILFRWKY